MLCSQLWPPLYLLLHLLHLTPAADSSAPAPAAVNAENAAAAIADQDMLSMIILGYSDDPWFATASHTDSRDVF